MSKHRPAGIASDTELPHESRVAIVAARFNAHIVDVLLEGCVNRLKELNLSGPWVATYRVPGAFELPVAAKWLAESGHFASVICLGCVIRGDTAHFEYVAGNAATGIAQVGLQTGVPVIFGVLTTENEQQALDRAGGSHGHAGAGAADAAVEMMLLREQVRKA